MYSAEGVAQQVWPSKYSATSAAPQVWRGKCGLSSNVITIIGPSGLEGKGILALVRRSGGVAKMGIEDLEQDCAVRHVAAIRARLGIFTLLQ